METLLNKLPFIWRLLITLAISVGIPGFVSFAVLKAEVTQIQSDIQSNHAQLQVYKKDATDIQDKISDKLEEIQRSLGRLEGKLDGKK